MTKEMTDAQRQRYIALWGASGMAKTLNIHLVDLATGKAVVEGFPAPEFYNAMLRLHGGYVAAMIDSGLGCAVQSMLKPETLFGTVEMNVHFVRKIDEATGRLLCSATVIHSGRTMLTAEAKVADEAGKIYAHGTGTFLVYPS